MIETIVLKKPVDGEDKTKNDIITEINKLQIPGVTNGFFTISSTVNILWLQILQNADVGYKNLWNEV
jgi:hypothetical protein